MTASAPHQRTEAQQAIGKAEQTRDALSLQLTRSEMILLLYIYFFLGGYICFVLSFQFKLCQILFEGSVALDKKQQPQESGLFQMLSTQPAAVMRLKGRK